MKQRWRYLNLTFLICCFLVPIFADDCTVEQYKCEVSGKCIGIDKICDGTKDCPDNEEDEWTCTEEPTKCLGPSKVCDSIKDCDNNEDEGDCCKHSEEYSPCTGSKDGWFWCRCSQTCIPPKEGDDPENPSWAVCNGKNDCCGTIHGVLSFSLECKDSARTNYTALDEMQENGEACVTKCAEGEIQCLHENDFPLPLKCIPEGEVAKKRCNGVNDCGTVGANDEMQENGDKCNLNEVGLGLTEYGHPAPQTEVINIECLPILHKAASDGNIQHVKSLIEHAEDINAMSGFRNYTKYTPLMLAAKNGHMVVVQYLHQHGANITSKDSLQFNALYYAADNGHLDVVKYLIQNGAKSDINTVTKKNNPWTYGSGTPLFIASRKGYLSIVTYLHQHGGDVNVIGSDNYGAGVKGTALFHAVRNGHIEIAQFLQTNGADDSGIQEDPLLMASAKGEIELVKNLLHSGTDVNVKGYLGYTPLIWASRMGRLETVKYLLQNGANMDAKTNLNYLKVRYRKEEDDLTSMLMASRYGHLQIVKYLHENGVDINFKNNKNEYALFLASFNGHVQVVKYLHEKGSDVNQRSSVAFYMKNMKYDYNTTPLAISARHGHLKVVEYLVQNGAEIDAGMNNMNGAGPEDNFTALHEAARSNQLHVVKFLHENGADINMKSKNRLISETYFLSPVRVAAEFGHFSIVKYLVENGAIIRGDPYLIPSAADMHSGFENGYLRIIKYLHEHGADIHAQNHNGQTGLLKAAKGGNFPIVQYLVDNGVDVNVRDMFGISALNKRSAGSSGNPEYNAIIAYLLANGAS